MFEAFCRAAGQIFDPRFRRLLLKGVGAALGVFVLLWAVIAVLLAETSFVPWAPVEIVLDLLGGTAAVVITLLLFPAGVGIAIGVMLEDVAGAVEARYYPQLGPARSPSVVENLVVALRFSGVLIVLNLIALPLYLIPGLNLALYYALNGYLLGREYFELGALRRREPARARELKRRHRGRLALAGVVIALLSSIPFANLLAPLVGVAAMVHIFQTLRGDRDSV